MKDISYFSKIYLAVEPVDFRKQANGLNAIISGDFELDNFENRSLFIFTNKRKSGIKMLYWDNTGFAMWVKNLEKSRFKWPKKLDKAQILVSSRDLKWLLQGVDIAKIKPHPPVKFDKTF